MSTWRSVSVSGSAVKRHVCSGCGNVYEYEMHRSSGASGKTVPSAESLKRNLEKALTEGCDMVPCPVCGLYQPEMVLLARKVGIAGESLILPVLPIVPFVAWLIYIQSWPWLSGFMWLMLGLIGVAVPGAALANPNAHILKTKNGTPVPGVFQGNTPARISLKRWAFFSFLTAVIGLFMQIGGPFFLCSVKSEEFNDRFLAPGIQPRIIGPGSVIALARNAFADEYWFHPLGPEYSNSRIEGKLLDGLGREIPLEPLVWTSADMVRFGLEHPPCSREALNEILAKRKKENPTEARVCPMILLRVPVNVPESERVTLSVFWEIEFIGRASGTYAIENERFDKNFNIKLFGKNARQIDAAYFWGRLALLLATGLANFMAAGVYDEAASITGRRALKHSE